VLVLALVLALAMRELSTEGASVSTGAVEKVPMPGAWEARPSGSMATPWLYAGMRGWPCPAARPGGWKMDWPCPVARPGGQKRGWPCLASKGAAKYSPGAAAAKF
jgi:hypothetical protein